MSRQTSQCRWQFLNALFTQICLSKDKHRHGSDARFKMTYRTPLFTLSIMAKVSPKNNIKKKHQFLRMFT